VPATSSEAVAARLTHPTDAAALIALVGDRVFPSKPPQENPTLPYVVWWETGGDGMVTLGGRSTLQPYEVRVECYAETEDESKAILAEVRGLLLLSRAAWKLLNLGVQGCFASEDADQMTLEDGTEVSGQTFRLHFVRG
jgi:hypothetical protein